MWVNRALKGGKSVVDCGWNRCKRLWHGRMGKERIGVWCSKRMEDGGGWGGVIEFCLYLIASKSFKLHV